MCAESLMITGHLHVDLASYARSMEASSLQKAAFAASARPGEIVDLGSGSGISAFDMAVLFPDSHITGVDLDENMNVFARAHYSLGNLKFKKGSAEEINFSLNSLDAVFMSSTGHHLTSYGAGKFDVAHVRRAIASVYAQLKIGGLFILRDFVVPDGDQEIYLDLPADDGLCSGDLAQLSTACFFETFARDFRSSQHPGSGIPFAEVGNVRGGWRRFRLQKRDAVEFVLHKDYRTTYAAEIKEEYTYMTQNDFEIEFRARGFRVVHSAPIFNPWIIENRFKGKFSMTSLDGARLPWPATNFVIVGEKIANGAGMLFRAMDQRENIAPNFLKLRVLRDRQKNKIYDVVERPNVTVDLVPYFSRHGRLYVLGKQGFPRPILTVTSNQDRLSGMRSDGYAVEPLSFIRGSPQPLFSEVEEQLARRGGVPAGEILQRGPGRSYSFYPSPGMVAEMTTSIAIPIRSRRVESSSPAENYSGFSSSGIVRPLEATQVLRSAQAGSVVDARLEIAVYHLLLDHHRPVGTWIGEKIQLHSVAAAVRVEAATVVLNPRRARVFEQMPDAAAGGFLTIASANFRELDSEGATVAERQLEFVRPKDWSSSVVSVLPVIRTRDDILVGLETRHLPAVQLHEGNSNLTTNPAWRIPQTVRSLDGAKDYATTRLREEFQVEPGAVFELGGLYNPSKGVTPETVHPVLVEVKPIAGAQSNLRWVRLSDLVEERAAIKDGHLLVTALRAAHALGVLP